MQSGCDATLARMRRKYTTAEFFAVTERLRAAFPGCALTTDLITGFPGETEEEFSQTLAFIEKCAFAQMHVFPYSIRPGTKAAELSDPVPRAEKQKWFDRLLEVQNRISREKNAEYVGRTLPVLIDGRSEDPNYDLTARTDGFKLVHLRGGEDRIGRFAEAEIDRSSTWALFGKVK